MTSREIFDMGLNGSAALEKLIGALSRQFSYCLVGGPALNCYCEPVYYGDTPFVVCGNPNEVKAALAADGFDFVSSKDRLSLAVPGTKITARLFFAELYHEFPSRANKKLLFDEIPVMAACLEDLIHWELLDMKDPSHSATLYYICKMNLARIWENFPALRPALPAEFLKIIEANEPAVINLSQTSTKGS